MNRRLLEILLVIGTLVLLVPVAEIIVRIAAPQTLPSQEMIRGFVLKDMYQLDETAGYRLTPGFSGTLERAGHVTRFSTNALGLRSDELGAKTQPRILALGDSFTWGWGVSQGEDWVHLLSQELAQREGGMETEPLNGGVNGYGTESALAMLRRIGDEVQPDLILVGFFANDYTDNLIGARNTYTVRDGYLFDEFSHRHLQESFLARESHLYRMLQVAWETVRVRYLGRVPNQNPIRNFSADDFTEGASLSEKWMLELRTEAERLGARLAVVWLPADVYALSRTQPHDVPMRAGLQQRIAEAGIPSIDLLPVVNREQRVRGIYLPNDGHFSVRGHRIAARSIAKWILEEGLLPQP